MKIQVSTVSGYWPLWAREGREIIYRGGWEGLMAVPIELGAELSAGKARPLFEVEEAHQYLFAPRNVQNATPPYDIDAAGRSLLMVTNEEPRSWERAHLNLVLNWFEELKQRVPTGR